MPADQLPPDIVHSPIACITLRNAIRAMTDQANSLCSSSTLTPPRHDHHLWCSRPRSVATELIGGGIVPCQRFGGVYGVGQLPHYGGFRDRDVVEDAQPGDRAGDPARKERPVRVAAQLQQPRPRIAER